MQLRKRLLNHWRGAVQNPGPLMFWGAAALSVLLLSVRAWELVCFQAESSLWTDEIFSVTMFSGRGLATSLSDYSLPNNHVLFNAINAVLPDRGSFDPLRARIVSFVAVGLGLLIAVIAFARRRAGFALMVFALAYLGDDRLLGVHLAARGYGMLALAAVLVCVSVWWFFEAGDVESALSLSSSPNLASPNSPPLWINVVLALSVAAGALTVPTFLFFGGSVMLAMFARRPRRRQFFAGLAVFLPVAGFFTWLYFSNHGFEKAPAGFFEGEFHELSAALLVVEQFALEGWPNSMRFAVVLFALAAPWLAPLGSARRETLWCLWWGTVGSLLICLVMKRPLVHTVAHLVIPGGFLVGLGIETLAQFGVRKWRWSPMVFGGLLLAAVTMTSLRTRDPLVLWPVESWREIAATISALGGDDAGADDAGGDKDAPGVWAPYRSEWLAIYLPGSIPVDADYDADAFRLGTQVVVASPVTKFPEEAVDAAIIDSAAVRLSLRQRAHSFQQIAWNPPLGRRAELVSAAPKPGATSGKTFSLRLRLPAFTPGEAVLYLYSEDPIMSKPPVVRAAKPGGGMRSLKVESVGPLWAVRLRSDIDLASPLEVVYYAGTAGEQPPGFVAWIGTDIPDAHVRRLIF